MRQPTSLTLRLTVLFGITATLVFSGFGWFIERSMSRHFSLGDVAELKVIAQTVLQALSTDSISAEPTALEQRFKDILVGHHGAYLYVAEQNGRTLYASSSGPNLSAIHLVPDNDNGAVQQWSDRDHTYRVLIQKFSDQTTVYIMSVAVAIDHHLQFLDRFRHTLWLMIVSGMVVMGLLGWVAVRQGHAPLHDIVAQIRRISASELNTRLSPDTVPREITDLAVSFNEMLERMEESFQRLSNFTADIAHELRTPVTSLLTQTQVALSQSRSVDEYREILYSNVEEYERMAQMIGDMLFLAKTDNGRYTLDSEEIDLAEEINSLFEYYEIWAEERGVSLVLEGQARLSVDRPMMRRALGNLLSNAIKHTPSGSSVKLQIDKLPDQTVEMTIENPGPAIAAEHVAKLFDRFYRVDASRQRSIEGVGLGLAITKSIIEIHGGKIEASSVDGYTRFRITIPKASAIA